MIQTVLVVDDEPMIREAVSSYLKSRAARCFLQRTAGRPLDLFEREAIAFVILDLWLPGI